MRPSALFLTALFVLQTASSAWDCGGVGKPLTKPAEMPRVLLDTRPPVQTGRVLEVNSGCSNLQQQINQARGGDTVQIPAGTTCTGNFVLPKRADGDSDWIVIRTATPDANLPPGTRVTPARISLLARILSPNSVAAFRTEPGAHHYRLIGLEISLVPRFSAGFNYGLVLFGSAEREQNSIAVMPTHLIVDRCYIHGQAGVNVSRAVALNSGSSAVIDSYLSQIHAEGFDTQAIAGWNGTGPYKITNNYLEGAGENIMFGGALAHIPDLVPSDIEIRNNHLFKPLSWRLGHPTYAGKAWTVKNLFEIKNGQRIWLDSNVFENNWPHSQSGFGILFTVRIEGGLMPWSAVQDITMTRNLIKNSASGINILGLDDNYRKGRAGRITIQNNLIEGLAPEGTAFQLLEGAYDITIDHNTAINTAGRVFLIMDGDPTKRLVFTNNIIPNGQYGLFGSGKGTGKAALDFYAPQHIFSNNLIVGAPESLASLYPACNYFAETSDAAGFAAPGSYKLSTRSRFRNAATDRKDLGADVTAIERAIQSTLQIVPATASAGPATPARSSSKAGPAATK